VTLAFLALSRALAAQGVPLDSVHRNFEPNGEHQLLVDGKVIADAEIFKNSKLPAYLVISSALPSPVLLTPRAHTVEAVPLAKISRQADGTVGLLADAALTLLGEFKLDGGSVVFSYEKRHASLVPKPPLLGLHSAGDLDANDPSYPRNAAEYHPSATAIAALVAQPAAVTVRVYFGSWCPHCREHVPRMLAVEEALAGSRVQVEYFGLPVPPEAWSDPEAQKLQIASVPTAIVYVEGKKVGRLVGADWNAPEVELARLVKTFSPKPS
jgi:thiol-disulfide isomerase/thioredoxin